MIHPLSSTVCPTKSEILSNVIQRMMPSLSVPSFFAGLCIIEHEWVKD